MYSLFSDHQMMETGCLCCLLAPPWTLHAPYLAVMWDNRGIRQYPDTFRVETTRQSGAMSVCIQEKYPAHVSHEMLTWAGYFVLLGYSVHMPLHTPLPEPVQESSAAVEKPNTPSTPHPRRTPAGAPADGRQIIFLPAICPQCAPVLIQQEFQFGSSILS